MGGVAHACQEGHSTRRIGTIAAIFGQRFKKVQWWPQQATTRTRSSSARRKREKEKQKQATALVEKERKETEILQPFGTGETSTTVETPWVATAPTRTIAALLPQKAQEMSKATPATEDKTDVLDKVELLKKVLTDKGITDEGVRRPPKKEPSSQR